MKKNLLLALLFLSGAVSAQVTVPGVFSDNAVLQKSAKTAVFGKAAPGEKVTVTYGKAKASAAAGKDGKWLVRLDLSKCDGKAKDLVIQGSNKIVAKNVITGEVWFCIGQSNMAWTLGRSLDVKELIAKSANQKIRMFDVARYAPDKPVDHFRGKWLIAGPNTSGRFTAVGYYFARRINDVTGRAVGLINPSWGGSSIESWISREKILKGSTPEVAASAQRELDDYFNYDKRAEKFSKDIAAYLKKVNWTDDGKSAAPPADARWQKIANISRNIKGGGVIWLRKEVNLTKDDIYRNRFVRFEFGRPSVPVKFFLDGKLIKSLDMEKAAEVRQWGVWVPVKNIKVPGKHVITLRVSAIKPSVGFPRYHNIGKKNDTYANWEMCREKNFPELDRKTRSAMPKIAARPYPSKTPTMIWNGMVKPLIPYTMKGAIWYQGEQNAGRQRFLYGDQVKALVSDLRERFGDPDFRFYAAQLPNFTAKSSNPNYTGNWPDVRAGQTRAMSMPNVAQAIIIDLGESGDIHPINKKPVGDRLAAIALYNDYGKKDVFWRSPEAVKAVRKGASVVVSFKYADGGLKAHKLDDFYWIKRSANRKAKLIRNTPNSQLEGFAVRGKDGKWFWADAKIDGNNVIVTCAKVKAPVAVRYAWQNNPTCNLFNGAGLPAGPFELMVK